MQSWPPTVAVLGGEKAITLGFPHLGGGDINPPGQGVSRRGGGGYLESAGGELRGNDIFHGMFRRCTFS